MTTVASLRAPTKINLAAFPMDGRRWDEGLGGVRADKVLLTGRRQVTLPISSGPDRLAEI
jgi:hypothetical protein